MQVAHVHDVLAYVIPEFISRSVGNARFQSATRHPHGEAMWVMITSIGLAGYLGNRGATEFTSSDHEGVIQQSALLQILDQGGNGTVDALALPDVLLFDVGMRIPPTIV